MSAGLDSPVYAALGKTFQRAQIGAGIIAFSQGVTIPLELPNALLQRGVTLRLTGNLVVTAATATILAEAPLGLLKNVRIVGDGRRQLISSPGRDLFRMSHFLYGKQPEISPPLGTAGTRAFSALVHIDHEVLNAMDPVESRFAPRLFKKVTVEILWGSATDIATAGGGGTIALTNVQCDVLVDQTAEGVDKILFDLEVSGDEAAVVASSRLFTFKVPQNGLLTDILLRSDRDSAPVDDLINSITLKSDTTVAHIDGAVWATLQRRNVLQLQLDGGATAGAQIPGYAWIGMMENGQIASALNTNQLNDLRLILDVTRTSGVELIHPTYRFLVPRKSLAQAVAA